MTSKPKVRGGIVGSGFAANLHYEGIDRVYGTDVDLVGIFSPTEANARRFAEPRGLRTFPSLDALLDPVDVVHVCASPAAHEAITIAALGRGVHAVVEKPLTGYFGDGRPISTGRADKGRPTARSRASTACSRPRRRARPAAVRRKLGLCPRGPEGTGDYRKDRAQILWIHGEEAHSGSHGNAYAWRLRRRRDDRQGLPPADGRAVPEARRRPARNGKPIRPKTVSARMHGITRLKTSRDEGQSATLSRHRRFFDDARRIRGRHGGRHFRLGYRPGRHPQLDRGLRQQPPRALQHQSEHGHADLQPGGREFRRHYVVEKIGTKQGWACTSPEEDWFTGFPQEIESFYRSIAYDALRNRQPAGRRHHFHDLQRLCFGREAGRRGQGARLLSRTPTLPSRRLQRPAM